MGTLRLSFRLLQEVLYDKITSAYLVVREYVRCMLSRLMLYLLPSPLVLLVALLRELCLLVPEARGLCYLLARLSLSEQRPCLPVHFVFGYCPLTRLRVL